MSIYALSFSPVFLTDVFCFVFLFSFRIFTLQDAVLLPGPHSTPDMAFLLVDIQHIPYCPCHGRVDLREVIGTVFMFGRENLECFHYLQLIQTYLTQDHQASVNKYLHFHLYLLLSSESIVLTADWSSGVHL